MEMKTYRMAGHYYGDNENYRTREEVAKWKERCPIKHLEEILVKTCKISQDELRRMQKEEEELVLAASESAKKEKEPSPQDLQNDLYDETYADISWKVYENQGR